MASANAYDHAVFAFLQRDAPGIAQVYFPGSAPPPVEAFGRLRDLRIEVEPLRTTDDAMLWEAKLRHPDWGDARIAYVRDGPPAEPFVRFAGSLTREEKDAASGPTVGIALTVPARRKEVLADRKTMLRFVRALLGYDGVVAIDMASQLPWGRAGLDEELAHDADLDIASLYCLHIVQDGATGGPEDGSTWMHTHGLHELGAFDLDVLAAHPTFVASSPDLFRALAFRALGGDITPGTDRVQYAFPRFELALVPADRFMREAAPQWRALRDADHHDDHRVVLCDPSRRRLFGLGGGSVPEPLSLARRRFPEPFAAMFPNDATALMARRAEATVDLFRSLAAEFEPYGVHVLAKLGLATRSGGREHLWFEVHDLR